MLIGEKYELLRSSVGMMIPLKYLVALGAMLLAGWNPAFAAGADDATVETGSTSVQTSKTHHKKHHSSRTSASETHSTTAAAGGEATAKRSTSETSTKKAASKTSAESTSTEAGTVSNATASTTPTGKSHRKKGHSSETAVSTNVPAGEGVDQARTDATASGEKTPSRTEKAPADKAAASSAAMSANLATPAAGGVAAAAATAVSGHAAASTTGKGKHHRHGAATAAIPQPPIVVNPAAVSPLGKSSATNPVNNATLSETAPSANGAPKIETVLPVPRPGAGTTASLPLAMVRTPAPEVKSPFSFSDFPTRKHTQSYPWKTGIVTTVFWIGEGSTPLSAMTNLKSAWDGNWVHNNGGADDQYDMSGYGSGSHASTLNPFYIALPFNDLAYPEKTSRWLPGNWPRPQRRGNRPMSACQHRWIEIKNRAGRVCFAQWEDVGPIVTDDAEYVFGSSRPSASRGLDVSPAVAKYLGIDSTAITSWRFVDDEDVLPGMWLRYDEQALLFRAMKERLHGGGANTRIQQLEEPTPEDADNDANQKKVGAARG